MNPPVGRYWPVLYAPAAAVAMGGVPCDYTLTPGGEATLDADLAALAEQEAEAG